MTAHGYASPQAFKDAIEHRLRAKSNGGAQIVRHRQRFVFDRFLHRLQAALGDTFALKGGLVLELRLSQARSTKDVDLHLLGSIDEARRKILACARQNFDDFMTFEVSEAEEWDDLTNDGLAYEGKRFHAECRLAGKIYGMKFPVDIAVGDAVVETPETVFVDWGLGIAGLTPACVRIYPVSAHLAEKIHAYTLPRHRENSRIKDLPDIALLAMTAAQRPFSVEVLRKAIADTFARRASHSIPNDLPLPPPSWLPDYPRWANEWNLPWSTLEEVTAKAKAFIDPVLSNAPVTTWSRSKWQWSR